jgi:hypothetical protein
MRLPRFRVQTLLVAVGAVALLIWAAIMGTRSYVYYRLATSYGTYERQWREMAARDSGNPARPRSIAVRWGPKIAEYYAPLAQKYRRAMWRPWMPVAPDPPAPVFGP